MHEEIGGSTHEEDDVIEALVTWPFTRDWLAIAWQRNPILEICGLACPSLDLDMSRSDPAAKALGERSWRKQVRTSSAC